MASPVDVSVRPYISASMPNAPVLTPAAGAGIAVLDAVLINGWDARTLTSLVVSGGVATATFAGGAHGGGYVDAVVNISGVTGALTALNGDQKVTGLTTTTVTFATAAANGTATGTVSMKVAPLGFSKVFSGTNLAVYKSNDVAASSWYLRVDDTDTLNMRVVAYETMSDVNTGTNPTPSAAQISGGLYWPKGSSAGATVIPWTIIGNSLGFYYMAQRNQSSSVTQVGVGIHYFGDCASFKIGDPYRGVLCGCTGASGWSGAQGTLANGSNATGCYIARLHTAVGTSTLLTTNSTVSAMSGATTTLGPYPSPVDNGLILTPPYPYAGAIASIGLRGVYAGLYLCPQAIATNSFSIGDIVNGSGDTLGRHLYAIFTPASVSTANDGTQYSFFDLTGPWVAPS